MLPAAEGATGAALQAFFGALPDNVWRAKGFMEVDDQPALVQFSLGQLVVSAAARMPHARLVFIGRRMDRSRIDAGFAGAMRRTASPSGA